MRSDLINMIRQLTANDRKTLSEKFTKLAEESGELASKVLPYCAAAGTRHRFVTKEDILEEIADCHLVLMSMVYDLGKDEEDLWEMMQAKSMKWAELQAADDICKSSIPFEIHVTVKAPVNAEHFRNCCKEIEVKPIILALQASSETILTDVMTSSVFYGDNAGVMNEVSRIAKHLATSGYQVVREKVETVPWHPAAPHAAQTKMPDGCYFECHFNVLVANEVERERLADLSRDSGCHLSKNSFKEYPNGSIVMMTYRRYDKIRETFIEDVQLIKASLLENGFPVEKEIVEFSIYDTNSKHDDNWLGNSVSCAAKEGSTAKVMGAAVALAKQNLDNYKQVK